MKLTARAGAIALAFALTAALLPASALGAAVTGTKQSRWWPEQIAYSAGNRERNHLDMHAISRNRVLVTDTGARLWAHGNCRQIDRHAATCPIIGHLAVHARLRDGNDYGRIVVPHVYSVELDAGPGADDVTADGIVYGNEGDDVTHLAPVPGGDALPENALMAYGGDGRDRLTGTNGNDGLDGQSGEDILWGLGGNDQLTGGQASDRLYGGPGDDSLDGDGTDFYPGPDTVYSDVIDGGSGSDTVRWAFHPRGIYVDLEHPQDAGEPGEHDHLSSIENVTGTRYADTILGTDGPNLLADSQGFDRTPTADRIDGRGGDDVIALEQEQPQLAGASLACGDGNDAVYVDGTQEPLVGDGCEQVGPSPQLRLTLPRVANGQAQVHYEGRPIHDDCGLTVTLRDPANPSGPDYGSATVDYSRRAPDGTMTIALTPAGQAAAAQGAPAVVDAHTDTYCNGAGSGQYTVGVRVQARL